MPHSHTCPGCAGRLQALRVHGVELDRCQRCRGTWLDGGELQQVTGLLTLEPFAGPGTRICARCHTAMQPMLLEGLTPVEQCPRCAGLFLDEGELAEVGLSPPSAPEAGDAFCCMACGRSLPLAESRPGAEGLVCPACAPTAGAGPGVPGVSAAQLTQWLGDVLRKSSV
jgi:Zn-finger nucleic acid-binding protein